MHSNKKASEVRNLTPLENVLDGLDLGSKIPAPLPHLVQ